MHHLTEPDQEQQSKEMKAWQEDLDKRRIRLANPPPLPVEVIKLRQVRMCTSGNLSVLSAQAKVGKSAVVGAIIAAAARAQAQQSGAVDSECDLLGLESADPKGRAVILIDTEQAPYDAWMVVKRSFLRAKIHDLPENIRCYRFFDAQIHERLERLKWEMEIASQVCNGVHLVVIDGVADLCSDPNNSEEANALVAQLGQLAVQYRCAILCVLHENPTNATGSNNKTRGHLGSQLERKAECNFKIVKDSDGTANLFAAVCRGPTLPKGKGVAFKYSEEHAMHVTVTGGDEASASAQRARHQSAVERVFEGLSENFTFTALVRRIVEIEGKGESTAKRWVATWRDLHLVVQDPSTARFRKA